MDRRDFILHSAAAVVGSVVGTQAKNEEPVAPDKIVETKGAANFDPWHFHWDQPMTRLTEKEAMGQVALGTPLFDPMMTPVDCGKRPLVMEQKLHDLPEPIYYLMGNAYLEILLHGERVARSPYGKNIQVCDVIGDGSWSLFMQGCRDINDKKDTQASRAVAEWICLNVDTSKGWEKILDHQEDWFARLVLSTRIRNIPFRATEEEAKAEWNANFRDALVHGPKRGQKGNIRYVE